MPLAPFFLAFTPALALVAAIVWGGIWLALPPALVWIIVPLADHFGGTEMRWGEAADAPPRWLCSFFVMAWAPLQLFLVVWGLDHALTTASVHGVGASVLLVVDLGLVATATGITFAHELMHRRSAAERALAEMLMASVSYPWFCVEHVYGHHRRVATVEDPASSRLGESLYAFLPRSLLGGLRSALQIEQKRLKKQGKIWWNPTSRIVRWTLEISAIYLAAYLWHGLIAIGAVALMGLVAVLLLEAINYIEHYGLQRGKRIGPQGRTRYDKVRPHHSWNSSHRVSNFMLLNLARHSDHHAHAARPWERLRHLSSSPQMPTGYGAMLLLAFVPPLWFAVMDPRVAQWRAEFHQTSDEIESASLA